MRKPFLVFGQPCIEQADIDEVVDSFHTCWLGTGPKVTAFEQAMAKYKNSTYAAAVNSCTAGLFLSLKALGIKPGDEVITSALTFCSTVNVIIHAGATPVLCDVVPSSMNLDPSQLEHRITGRTRAIIPVHMAGRPCAMDEIMRIATQHGLHVVEDCAHAIETEFQGAKAGTMGTVGVLSFYATKNLTTGEGGMILTESAELCRQIKRLALHGLSADAWARYSDSGYRHYLVEDAGYKYNMTDVQAAMGLRQLERIERYARRRREIWDAYNDALATTSLQLPSVEEPNTRHARHLYTVLVDRAKCGVTRDDFINRMTQHGIGVGVHYLSIPEHPFYQRTFGWRPEDWPHAMQIGRQTVSLPISGCLSDAQIVDVSDAVRASLAGD